MIWRAQGIALLLTAPLGLPELMNAHWTVGPLLCMLALGTFGTAIANVVMASAAGRFGAARASSTTFLIPVVALLLGVLVRGERVALISVVWMSRLCHRRVADEAGEGAIRLSAVRAHRPTECCADTRRTLRGIDARGQLPLRVFLALSRLRTGSSRGGAEGGPTPAARCDQHREEGEIDRVPEPWYGPDVTKLSRE